MTTTKPPPVIEGRQDRCDLTSRIFRTFDGGEFSYDICHHILVRDRIDDLWAVTIHKNCSNLDQCTRALRIRHGKKDVISLLPNFRIGFNNFEYAFYQVRISSFPLKFTKLTKFLKLIVGERDCGQLGRTVFPAEGWRHGHFPVHAIRLLGRLGHQHERQDWSNKEAILLIIS